MFVAALAFIFILGLLIFIHELGHFVAARAANIKVEEFAFGFPPRIFSVVRGETRYAINLLPFGGYVRLLGEDGSSADPRSFAKQRVRIRLAVIVAGVVMNVLLAIVALWVGFMIGMVPVASSPAELGGQHEEQVMVTYVRPGSPADQANLAAGDLLLGFSSPEEVQTYTQTHANESVSLQVRRNGTVSDIPVALTAAEEGPLGVGLVSVTKVQLSPVPALQAAVIETGKALKITFIFLGDFFAQLFSKGQVAEGVSGPVGIFSVTAQAVSLGWSYVLQLLAVLSINLALLNILPFPALDGGRALFVVLEGVIRRKVVREEIENIIHAIGFLLLLALIVLVTYHDIARLG